MIKSLDPLINGSVQYRQKKPLFFHYGESFFLSVYILYWAFELGFRIILSSNFDTPCTP